MSHFLLNCPNLREHFDSLLANLNVKTKNFNDIDGRPISEFIAKLDRHQKALLLLGCLPLPFDAATVTMIAHLSRQQLEKFTSVALRGWASWRLRGYHTRALLTLFRFCNFYN